MPRPSLPLAFAGALAFAAFCGCESSRTLRIASDNPSGFSYDPDGTVVLRSEKKHNVAVRIERARGTSDTASLPALTVYVTNGGKNSIAVGPENISAVTGDRPVPVLGRADTASRLLRENASAPARTSQTIGPDASMPGESGFPKEMSNNTPVYNNPYPSVATASTSQPKREILPPDSNGQTRLDRVIAPLLVRTPIPPGQTAGGTVKLDPTYVDRGAPVRLTVAIDGEQHEFLFTVQ